MPTVTAKIVSDKLRIYIDGIIHLSIDITELVAIQAYTFNDDRWHIDFTMKTTQVETWYTTRDLWESILKAIDGFDLV